MRRVLMRVVAVFGLVALASVALEPIAVAAPWAPYFNGFENAADVDTITYPNDAMYSVTRVASGTDGITSADGGWHAKALASAGSFTRYGGYSSVFPPGGYTTSVDIYLDTAASPLGQDIRFDWSSAISDTAGAHRRDFIFSVGTDGSGGFVMSASNNSPGWPANPARDPFTITTTGWYTFQHEFYDAGGGVLAVDMSVLDASDSVLHTWTLSDPTDIIGSTVGGNRYGWLVVNGFSFLALDNLTRSGLPQCTTTCYVDAVNGNDAFGGDTPATAKKTIQAALNQVSAGGTVRVLPGTYNESAPGSTPTSLAGTYQFGLFFHSSKPGITVMGVTAGDAEITDTADIAATVNTNATNNFGHSGIFVEAADTTIQGLEIGPNTAGDNKTVEVVTDNFTLRDVDTSIPGGGSIYINDFSTAGDVVASYHILESLFDDGTSIDISSGAGSTGLVSDREILDNTFDLNGNWWNAISFNGSGTGVPWFVNTVGGAIIQGNDFSGGTEQYIRARGTYDNSQFDWESYWNDNTFDKAVVDLVTESPFDVQTFSYTSGSYTFNDVRRIGTTIQMELDHAVDGDTVLVAEGTYEESPNIDASVTLKSDDGRDVTTIDLQTSPTYLGALTIDGADVTVDGFTIEGNDASCPTLASSNVVLTTNPDAVAIVNNRFLVGATDGACANGDDGIGVLTTYTTSSDVDTVTVDGNLFEPLGTEAFRAFYVNPGVNGFTFANNDITGKFTATSITQAKDGLVEDNTIVGPGSDGAGLGTWGYPDATVYGHTTFRGNDISGVLRGITVFETNDVLIEGNEIHDNDVGIRTRDAGGGVNYDPTKIDIHLNNITDNATAGVENTSTTTGTVDAECNWWGDATGPAPSGSGDAALGDLDYTHWLLAPAPGGACIGGMLFEGFFSPVDNDPALNIAKAGQTIPVKWRLTDEDGNPIDDPASFASLTSDTVSCGSLLADGVETDAVETYSGGSGLQSKGDGNWQFNWATKSGYKGQCRAMVLTLSDGTEHVAYFKFK